MRVLWGVAVAVLLAAVAAGCGSGSQAAVRAAPSASEFPSAKGKTLETLRAGLPPGPVLAPSTAYSLETGVSRVAAALFTVDHRFISNADVAFYTTDHDGRNAKGPYPATFESLAPQGRYQSRTTVSDLATAGGVYVAHIPIARPGRRVFTAVARMKGKLYQTTGFELGVGRPDAPGRPPDVGQRPPLIHTQTVTDVAGDASKIDTRSPPATDLLTTDFADVVGKKPVVITFATPLLCQSRVCGPVVDLVEQVKAQTKGKVAFIHQEIYRNNQVNQGYRPQVTAWHLPTEPWTFVLDKTGRITARFEGAFGAAELQQAVNRVAS